VSGWKNIQGNIVRGYADHGHAGYLFTRITEPVAARRLLARLIPRISTEDDWGAETPPSRLNVAFTYPGLQALGVDMEVFDQFDDFRAGMYERARSQLGDLGANDPDNWDPGLSGAGRPDGAASPRGAHVLFTVYGLDAETRKRELGALERDLPDGGMQSVCVQRADSLKGSREHFGFQDGYSQPSIAGVSDDRRRERGEGVLDRRWPLLGDRWRNVRLGEFILGYEDEDGINLGEGKALLTHGTFMVWRKLQQHVDEFQDWIRAQVGDDPDAQAWLKAKIVGRWPSDGESLVRRAAAPPAGTPAEDDQAVRSPDINAFDYGGDVAGLRCPLGAHVRRSNPRDALGFRTERTRRNRIIRRGMPYTEKDERGLVFVCFNASISRQFEQIQGNWLMGGDAFGLGEERDFLTGGLDHAGQMTRLTVHGHRAAPPRFLTRDRQFVTVRGGYYLFVPGLPALGLIADPASA
jgi:Dyp-type peroxidase family